MKNRRATLIPIQLLIPFGLLFASLNVAAQTPAGWNREQIAIGNVSMEVFTRGSGTTVIMHPSLGRPAQDFEALGNSVVEEGFRVVLVNPRGIGDSTGPMDGVVLQDLANDVWKIADALNIQQTFILGQNFGNRVSRTVSSLQPDRVIGLILMAAGGEIEPSEQVWEEFRRVFDPSLSPERHLQAVANSFFAPGNDASVWTDGWFSQTATQQTEAAKRTDFKPLYNGGTAPMLVIQGLNDKIAPPENAWNLVNRRPDARLVALPNMGHAMLPERPQQLADAVVNFLHELDN